MSAKLKKNVPKEAGLKTNPSTTEVGGGRERLLKAALRLGARNRSIANLGLRELAREAGMHHTAIYRHFKSIDEVAVALVEPLSTQLRADLRMARRNAKRDPKDMIRASTQRYFEYVREHPLGVIFCAREIHGGLPSLREALQKMLDEFAADSAEDLSLLGLQELLPDYQMLLTLTHLIAQHTLFAALDYLEKPERGEEVVERTVIFVECLIVGAIARHRCE
ncbi:TetR family transcriptional regulator [Zhongshania sp.]|uniref:TetR family transcriptional regulator n=1 Tax=Zhongshania sp. TaxID=1971902 RepID=UPI003563C070